MKRGTLIQAYGYVRRIYGVDFSGGKNAGKKTWIAFGAIEGDTLRIKDYQRASDL
jgi:hypothetical protein